MNVLWLVLGLLVGALLAARWQARRRGAQSRQQIEDALKHLFEQEYRGRRGSLASLAGALRMPEDAVVALADRMAQQGLMRARGQEFDLTPAGERLALQIVRAHRLLERYFADEARLPLGQVHAAAEQREHTLSPAEVERLSASLGHPTFDPHGDPIPSRDGAVPPATGTPATSWAPETTGRIVHLEDEPQISFAQILAEGLHVGQTVRLIESTPQRVVLTDGENEFRLAPAVAANIFLTPAAHLDSDHDIVRLSTLGQNEDGEIVALDDRCQGFSRRRLMDLGFTQGARIRPVLETFARDPRAYQVRGTVVALRTEQASQVLVRRVAEGAQGAA